MSADDGADWTSGEGRDDELRLVRVRFRSAVEGRAAAVLLAGDPGIGKSWLLQRILSLVAREGAVVLRGGASEAQGMPPYMPLIEALGLYIRGAPTETLRGQTGDLAGALCAILPELRLRLGPDVRALAVPPEQGRLRLFEAVCSFVRGIAIEAPLVVALDDLQWADAGTLDLIGYVLAHAPATRLLLLGAYRPAEATRNPALQRTLVELSRLRVAHGIDLGPLSQAAIGLLASRRAGASLDEETMRLLFGHSEGNPFFAEELLRGWLDATVFEQSSTTSRVRLARREQHELPLPRTIAAAVQQRLARLAAETVELLRTAAIIGRDFEVEFLAEVAGSDAEEVDQRLEMAVEAGLLLRAGGSSLSFSHDKIRETLYDQVTPLRRRRLHGFIGRALEQRPDHDQARELAQLAFHFGHSGDRERGADYAERAAEQSLATFAPGEAVALLRTALELRAPMDARRGALTFRLGEAAILAGEESVAADAFAAARDLFLAAGERAAAGRASHGLGSARWRREEVPQARAAFEAAVELLSGGPVPDLVRVLVELGSLLGVSLHRNEEGIACCARALALAEQLQEPVLIASAARALGNLEVRRNRLTEGIRLLESALSAAEAADDPWEAAECCAFLSVAYFWRGVLAASEAVTHRRLAFAQRCHNRYQMRHVFTWLAVLDGLRGRNAAARRLLDQAESTVEALESPEPRAYLAYCRGALALSRGRYAESETLLREAIELFRDIGPGALVWYEGMLCHAFAAQHKLAEASAHMHELEALMDTFADDAMATGEALEGLTQAALLLDDGPRLERYYPLLLPFEGQLLNLLIDRLLGEIELRRGDLARARVHLEAAQRCARSNPLPFDLALTLEDLASLAERERSQAEARALLTEAAAVFESIGNETEAARVRAVLRQSAAAERTTAPARLSSREIEILRLVAAGKSNRAIAGELFLSEKTVENHLTSIYAKTATDNRAAATAFAIRNGLA